MTRKYASVWTKCFSIIFFETFFANYKMPMTNRIRAIHIIFRLLIARITDTYYFMFCVISIKAHSHSSVKDIQLALEIFVGIFFHIAYNTAVKLINIFKSRLI